MTRDPSIADCGVLVEREANESEGAVTLADLDLLDDWYQFESAERLRAIRDWCFAHGLRLQE